jgi:VIT1/CCC1 family predicted Fe2+/Mn2+ transporter
VIRIVAAILLAVLVLGVLGWILARLTPKHGHPGGPTSTFVVTTS